MAQLLNLFFSSNRRVFVVYAKNMNCKVLCFRVSYWFRGIVGSS